jgi:hypothetical protein
MSGSALVESALLEVGSREDAELVAFGNSDHDSPLIARLAVIKFVASRRSARLEAIQI